MRANHDSLYAERPGAVVRGNLPQSTVIDAAGEFIDTNRGSHRCTAPGNRCIQPGIEDNAAATDSPNTCKCPDPFVTAVKMMNVPMAHYPVKTAVGKREIENIRATGSTIDSRLPVY